MCDSRFAGVKLCATHGVRRVGRSLDLHHPFAGPFMRELTYAMYEVDCADVEEVLDDLKTRPGQSDLLAKLAPTWVNATSSGAKVKIMDRSILENPKYWHHQSSVRRGLREKTEMEKNCLAVCYVAQLKWK